MNFRQIKIEYKGYGIRWENNQENNIIVDKKNVMHQFLRKFH